MNAADGPSGKMGPSAKKTPARVVAMGLSIGSMRASISETEASMGMTRPLISEVDVVKPEAEMQDVNDFDADVHFA